MPEKDVEWERLVNDIRNCTRCPLHRFRRNPVPGEGSLDSAVMFLGEAPGRSEDEAGRPFVGAAGRLLNELLNLAGLDRGEVFITNVVKCRPPNNRDPRSEEVAACSVHTNRIIGLVRPRVIVTLGNHAGRYIFERFSKMRWLGVKAMRGRIYRLNVLNDSVVVIATYHPAAALYNPQLKGELEEDFKVLLRRAIKLGSALKQPTLLDFMGR